MIVDHSLYNLLLPIRQIIIIIVFKLVGNDAIYRMRHLFKISVEEVHV